jgi:ABC-type sugar transport system permease subunit
VLITLITVPGALVVGLGLALLANLPFKRQWPVRLALLLPWALPLSFVGLIFAWFFHTDYGVVNDVLRRLGSPEPTMWLLGPGWAFAAICGAIVWKTSSFMALILLAGLQMIPKSLTKRRGRRRQPLAAVLAGDDPDADAQHRGRLDLPHDHGFADLRHPVHDDPRWAGQQHRNAGHADPQDDHRLPRRGLRLDAGGVHVRAVAVHHRVLSEACRECRLMPVYSPRALRLLAAGIVVLNGFFPALWILLTSLKTETELVSKPITYWPQQATLHNYVQAFTDQPLLRYLANSAAVAVGSTLMSLLVAALAAYAIARLNLKHRQLILTCHRRQQHVPAGDAVGADLRDDAGCRPVEHLHRADRAVHRAQPAGVHARPGELLPEHPAGPGERRDDRRLHAHWRFVAGGRAAGSAWGVHCRHPGFRECVGRIPAGAFAQRQRFDAHLARRHHAVPGRVHVSVADHFCRAHRRDRADCRADCAVPGACGGRLDPGRLEG